MSFSPELLSLSDNSREVAVHIAGYIVKKLKKRLGNCCKEHLSGNLVPENSDFSYVQILWREGLTISSINLVNYVFTAFEILDYLVDVITQFHLPPRTAAERILCHSSSDNFEQYKCSIHESIGWRFCNRAVANIFSNNKRKHLTDFAGADSVKAFKKRQREKFYYPKFLFFILKFYHIKS